MGVYCFEIIQGRALQNPYYRSICNPQVCQECEENLPTELVKQMMTGSIAYCEACGAQLHELSEKDY